MTKYLFYILTFLGIWIFFFNEKTVDYGPGVLSPSEPLQTNISSAKSFKFKDYDITPLASFDITAKVLSKEEYTRGEEAKLSPLDVALGWGRMSDSEVTKHLNISQSGRWYRWSTEKFPIPRAEIETHSANMHLIPKTPSLKEKVLTIRQGDIINIKGKLVRIQSSNGWHWKSSLTRSDTGKGACEIIFVEDLHIQNLP